MSVLDTHVGAVRSFELAGTAATVGRRWAARCSCGAVATTGAWPEALAYLGEHRRAMPSLRTAWTASRPTPDLRGVEYRRIEVVLHTRARRHSSPVMFLRQIVAEVLNSLTRIALRLN